MYINHLERLNNRDKILSIMHKYHELTKFELAQKTNISIPTVTSNVKKLMKEGLIDESGVATSTGGRKPKINRIIPNSRFSIGVDITPTKLKIIVIDLCFNVKKKEEFLLDQFKIANDLHQVIVKVAEEIHKILTNLMIPLSKITGICLAVPGTVNRENYMLELAPNLGIKEFSLKFLRDIFSFPIYIENEANAGAFGEMILGHRKHEPEDQIVYVSITEGIGTSIITKEGFFKGNKERAGEFGHMHIGITDKPCKCGRIGCWELFSSETTFLDMYKKAKGITVASIDEIVQQYVAKDKETRDVVSQYLNNLALGLQNILLAIDPKTIIIGGELARYSEHFIEELRNLVFSKSVFHSEKDVEIMFSNLDMEASLLGAAVTPFKKLFISDS